MLLKAILVWLAIAVAETLHGILRVRFLNRQIGDHRSRQVGVFSGSLIILAISWFTLPWIGPRSVGDCLAVGGLWTTLMLAFDVGFGRLFLRMPWTRIRADFDVRKGGFLAVGMAVLFLAPLIIAKVRHLL